MIMQITDPLNPASIGFGILLLTALGGLLGFGLAIIAKIFSVEIDPRIEKIMDALPGINCGACGYPGCSGYAEAIVKDDVEINLCSPGGGNLVELIAKLLGKQSIVNDKYVAKIFCLGDDAIAKKDYIFNGEEDCLTVHNFFQGDKACKYSCVGKGNCIKICPVDAIKRDELNRVWIDSVLCVGCERCVAICPTSVIHMVPEEGGHFVACSSHYNGKTVREICKKGCIACKICVKVAGEERIYVENNLAYVHYENKTDLTTAAMKCPANVILPIKEQNTKMVAPKKEPPKKAPVKQAAPKAGAKPEDDGGDTKVL